MRGISGGVTDVAWHDLDQWPDAAASFGPALAMGVALNAIWPGKVAVLQISRGGSSMADWQPGEFFHTAATDTINAARALLLAEFPGETEVYWHFVAQQGETDQQDANIAVQQAWAAGLETVKASWETLLGQSLRAIIVGTNQNISGAEHVGTLRAQQLSVADQFVDTDFATTVDGLHNDSATNNTIGGRIADAIYADYLETNGMIEHATDVRTAIADLVVDSLDAGSSAGKLIIREGTTVLGTVTLADPAFGDAAAGVATLLGTPLVGTWVANGDADNFLAQDSDGNTKFGGSVTATGGGGDMALGTVTIDTSEVITITGGSYTAPP
jgi:hypothetical protein